MRSNSFEIWTIHEVQCMLRCFIKSWKCQEIKPKNWFSGSFMEGFPITSSLTPYELCPNFLIKIPNRGKFYEYSILDSQIINFQRFSYRFSIYKMPLFGEVLSPNSPKYCQILLQFSPQVVFKETETVF